MTSGAWVMRWGLLVATLLGTIAAARAERRGDPRLARFVLGGAVAVALAWIAWTLAVFADHAAQPFNLEAMETTVLEHVRRVLDGRPLYPPPTSDFAALAYNPLFYYVAAPLVRVLGPSLLPLRLTAIAGAIGAGIMVFAIVRRRTGSAAWGTLALGTFAVAYRAQDCYLDMAHADSWMLCSVLLGCVLLDGAASRAREALGLAALVAGFWFKQPAVVFVAGALAAQTGRRGFRGAWVSWAVAALGAALYLAAPAWWGPRFIDTTWLEPQRWLDVNGDALVRLLGVCARFLPLALFGVAGAVTALIERRFDLTAALLPVALVGGLAGAADAGSNDNVFIPLGTWFIVTGVPALARSLESSVTLRRWGAGVAALGLAWTALAYDPRTVLVPAGAERAARDLTAFARGLDGPVYAPMIGSMPGDNPFSPTLHWVPLEDLIRGPAVDEGEAPLARRLLDPVLHPRGSAYILFDSPLEQDELIGFLARRYTLERDLGDRFAALAGLPRRYRIGGPRYLYRAAPRPRAED